MRKITVAMIGARRHYAIPRLLHEAGLLDKFVTDSYVGNKPLLRAALKSIPRSLASAQVTRWLGRSSDALPGNKVHSNEFLGLWYAWKQRSAHGHEKWYALNREVSRRFARTVRRAGIADSAALWAFDYAALESFQLARQAGLRCILEQTVLPRREHFALMRAECERWPGWQPDLQVPQHDAESLEREEQELAMADRIIVGSSYVKDCIDRIRPGMPVTLVRSGVDTSKFRMPPGKTDRQGRPLRLLFVGEVGLRKGIQYLLEAVRDMPASSVEVRVAGTIKLQREQLAPYAERVRFLGAVPRLQMMELYAWADVMILPSIVEGSALSTYEALLSGVPVITTANAGSVVTSGADGFLVPAQDSGAIRRAIETYLDEPDTLARHTLSAAALSGELGLERYQRELADFARAAIS